MILDAFPLLFLEPNHSTLYRIDSIRQF